MQGNRKGNKMRKIVVFLFAFFMLMPLASCSGKKLEKRFETMCSADEALELSRQTDTVIIEDLRCTSGKEVWSSFYNASSGGDKSSVLCAYYYTLDQDNVSVELYEEEKDKYPVLFFSLIEYDGEKYSIKTRDSSLSELDSQDTYNCLLHFENENYDIYILTDDPSLTLEEINRSEYSSNYNAFIKHTTVYSDYHMKQAKQEVHDFCKGFPSPHLSLPDEVFFVADVTGDGFEDLSTSLYCGSGMVRTDVIVYDVTNDEFYVLDSPLEFHVVTAVHDGRLVVRKDNEEYGTVMIDDGELVFVSDGGSVSSSDIMLYYGRQREN